MRSRCCFRAAACVSVFTGLVFLLMRAYEHEGSPQQLSQVMGDLCDCQCLHQMQLPFFRLVPLQGAEDGLQDMHRMQERLQATVR